MVQEILYLNDERKVLQIAPKYMKHFHKYALDKQMTRKKRSSKIKVGVFLKTFVNKAT